jgi:hypothetical protein
LGLRISMRAALWAQGAGAPHLPASPSTAAVVPSPTGLVSAGTPVEAAAVVSPASSTGSGRASSASRSSPLLVFSGLLVAAPPALLLSLTCSRLSFVRLAHLTDGQAQPVQSRRHHLGQLPHEFLVVRGVEVVSLLFEEVRQLPRLLRRVTRRVGRARHPPVVHFLTYSFPSGVLPGCPDVAGLDPAGNFTLKTAAESRSLFTRATRVTRPLRPACGPVTTCTRSPAAHTPANVPSPQLFAQG